MPLLKKLLLSSIILLNLSAEPVQVALGYDKTKGELLINGFIDENWHVYWKNPGESGLPTKFEVDLDGEKVDLKPQWSVPEIFMSANKRNIGYSKQFQVKYKIPTVKNVTVRSKILGCSVNVCKPIRLENSESLSNLNKPENFSVTYPNEAGITRVGNSLMLGIPLKGQELVSGSKAKFVITDAEKGIIETPEASGEILVLSKNPTNFTWIN